MTGSTSTKYGQIVVIVRPSVSLSVCLSICLFAFLFTCLYSCCCSCLTLSSIHSGYMLTDFFSTLRVRYDLLSIMEWLLCPVFLLWQVLDYHNISLPSNTIILTLIIIVILEIASITRNVIITAIIAAVTVVISINTSDTVKLLSLSWSAVPAVTTTATRINLHYY